MIYDYFRVTGANDTVLDYADLFSVTLRNDDVQDFDTRWDNILSVYVKDSIRWYSGESMQIDDTRVWSTQNRIRIVRHGNSSKKIVAQLSEVEEDGEKKHRSETSMTKFWSHEREKWDRDSGYESPEIEWYW